MVSSPLLTLEQIAMPSSVITTGSNVMFTGITGVYEVCASLTGALTSLGIPFVARFLPYDVSMAICTLSTALAYLIPTLPHPLVGGETPQNKAAPIIGTMFGGFIYAFGTNVYMAAAAFFPPEAVLALSSGSGCAIILGPGLYTAFMAGLDNDWRRTFLVFLSTTIFIPIVWWGLTDAACRKAAENSRIESLVRSRKKNGGESDSTAVTEYVDVSNNVQQLTLTLSQQEAQTSSDSESSKPGFGQHRSRTGFLIKTIFPRYVLPLIFCTCSAIVTLLGTSPTLQALNTFHNAPNGNLQFQFSCK